MTKKLILNSVLILVISFSPLTSNSQANSPDSVFIGKWISKDQKMGYVISAECISPIYKDSNNTWEISHWNNENSIFLDTSLNSTNLLYENWALLKSTLIEDLVKGGVVATAIFTYSVYRIEVIDSNTIKLSVSSPHIMYGDSNWENIKKMKEQYSLNKQYRTSVLLNRL